MRTIILLISLLTIVACKPKNGNLNTETNRTQKSIKTDDRPSLEIAEGLEPIHFDGTTLAPGKWPLFRVNVLQPIIDLDRSKIKEMVDFPLDGDWKYLLGDRVEPTSENFYRNIDMVFNEELREELAGIASQDISYNRPENRYEVVINTSELVEEGSDDIFESAYILHFKDVGTVWKLVAFHLAG